MVLSSVSVPPVSPTSVPPAGLTITSVRPVDGLVQSLPFSSFADDDEQETTPSVRHDDSNSSSGPSSSSSSCCCCCCCASRRQRFFVHVLSTLLLPTTLPLQRDGIANTVEQQKKKNVVSRSSGKCGGGGIRVLRDIESLCADDTAAGTTWRSVGHHRGVSVSATGSLDHPPPPSRTSYLDPQTDCLDPQYRCVQPSLRPPTTTNCYRLLSTPHHTRKIRRPRRPPRCGSKLRTFTNRPSSPTSDSSAHIAVLHPFNYARVISFGLSCSVRPSVRLSVCPIGAPSWKTKRRRKKNKIDVNVQQGRSNLYPNF